VHLTSLGQHQLYAQQRNQKINPSQEASPNSKFQYSAHWKELVTQQFKHNKSINNPNKQQELYQVAKDLYVYYNYNLDHSLHLYEAGWGLKQATKDQIRNVARRVGLEITREGQTIEKNKPTSLAGTAAEKYRIGEGVKGNQTGAYPVHSVVSESDKLKNH
jgi:hypothetical protein